MLPTLFETILFDNYLVISFPSLLTFLGKAFYVDKSDVFESIEWTRNERRKVDIIVKVLVNMVKADEPINKSSKSYFLMGSSDADNPQNEMKITKGSRQETIVQQLIGMIQCHGTSDRDALLPLMKVVLSRCDWSWQLNNWNHWFKDQYETAFFLVILATECGECWEPQINAALENPTMTVRFAQGGATTTVKVGL